MAEPLLLHVCCGPCAITSIASFREAGYDPTGLFHNPNIQPVSEYLRRREAAAQVAAILSAPILFDDANYDPLPHLQASVAAPKARCLACYHMRLAFTAHTALARGIKAFSTTLLYSKYQNHEAIRTIGHTLAEQHDLVFAYRDLRTTWELGITRSRELGIYRQNYCGCILSEYERFKKKLKSLGGAPPPLGPCRPSGAPSAASHVAGGRKEEGDS